MTDNKDCQHSSEKAIVGHNKFVSSSGDVLVNVHFANGGVTTVEAKKAKKKGGWFKKKPKTPTLPEPRAICGMTCNGEYQAGQGCTFEKNYPDCQNGRVVCVEGPSDFGPTVDEAEVQTSGI